MNIVLDEDQLEIITDTASMIDGQVQTNYSRRGMYGDSCVGVVYPGDLSETLSTARRTAVSAPSTARSNRACSASPRSGVHVARNVV